MGKVSEKRLICSKIVSGYLDAQDVGLFVRYYIPNDTYELFIHDIIDDMFNIGLTKDNYFTFDVMGVMFTVYYSASGRFKNDTVIVSITKDYLADDYHISKDNFNMDGLIEFILQQI